MRRISPLNFIRKGSILLLVLIFLYFTACGEKEEKAVIENEAESLEETEISKNEDVNEEPKEFNNEILKSLEMKDGSTLKVGDEVAVMRDLNYEGAYFYLGEVVDMYPETGCVLETGKLGVVKFYYRYVIDIKATKKTKSYDSGMNFDDEYMEPIDETIRGVVTLYKDGQEIIRFIRNLDGKGKEWFRRRIEDSSEYEPAVYYDVKLWVTEGTPKEIIDFYNEGEAVN